MLRPKRTTLLYSAALLLLGLGIGCSGTLLVQKWTTPPPAPVRPKPEPPPAPKLTTDLLLEGEPAMGAANAPLTIVEFSDFECVYCQRFHEQVLPQLKQQYVDRGLVRFVHKDLPLPFHQHARPTATAARCAGEQNRYWEMYEAIFDQQSCLECKGVTGIAKEQKLDTDALEACMKREATQALVNANLSEAELHNIRATPTFVIGPTQAGNKHSGEIIEGAMPWPQFKALVDAQLKAVNKP
ncbi:DsbA family protein [Synechococcus sp. UW140]|uniref:DsbA family protein n=1 Tax=Synechococcus sp. UW140 TaxID=368503 RepID=UPI000E0EAFE9|nr:DsbA family protein [Synechococcus sp. UW140]